MSANTNFEHGLQHALCIVRSWIDAFSLYQIRQLARIEWTTSSGDSGVLRLAIAVATLGIFAVALLK